MVQNYFSDTKTLIVFPPKDVSPWLYKQGTVNNLFSDGSMADSSLNGYNSVCRLLSFGTMIDGSKLL